MISRFRLLLAAASFLFFPLFLSAQTITTQPLGQSTFCAGNEISVDFTVTGAFNPGNAMILQLSNPNGSFTSGFRNLGSVSTTASGTIIATLPEDLSSGTRYRVRVIGSNPRVDGSDNGADLAIDARIDPKPDISWGVLKVPTSSGDPWVEYYTVEGMRLFFTGSAAGAKGIWWNLGIGVGAAPEQTGEADSWVTYTQPGDKQIRFLAYGAAGCEWRKDLTLHVLTANNPVIPADAVIVQGEVKIDRFNDASAIWVCPGGVCRISSRSGLSMTTVYVEGGGSVIAEAGAGTLVVYMKSGASFSGQEQRNFIFVHEAGAGIPEAQPERSLERVLLPSLTFDYSNVPPGGCPSLAPYTVQIKPNANSIHTAQNDNRSDAEYWVRDGGALTSTGEGNAYYVEAGGHVVVEGSHNRVYVKNGGTVDVQSGSENRIFYELQGTIVNSGADAILLPSSGITFESEVSGVAEESVTAGGNLIAISPNPAEEFAEVRVDAALGRVRSVRVYSLLGEEVKTFASSGSTLRIDLAGYVPGPYYVKIETEKGLYVRKLMKR